MTLPTASGPASGAPSGEEAALLAAVDRAVPAGLALLERAVNQNSGTLNPDGVREVGRIFLPELQTLGFEARWVDGTAWNRAGHLLAVRPARSGASGKDGTVAGRDEALRVLLIGHLDTVFEPDSPFQRYHALSDTAATGPGVIDMKGGNVVMLLALRALRETGILDRMEVRVILSGDEENPGDSLELARRDLLELARGADIALGFEDGDGDPRTAVVSRRGTSRWVLRTWGRPSHSSQIFQEEVGSGAIYEAARILAAFHDSLSHEPLLTLNPGFVVGGTTVGFQPELSRGTAFGKTNVVAESTAVAGDLRSLTFEQRDRAKATMRRLVEAHLPRTGARIEFEDGYPPLGPVEGNLRLLARFDQVSRDLGFGPVTAVDPARAGAADISFTAGIVPMALDGLGLMGTGGHTVEETADLRTLPMQAKRVAVLLARLAGER